MPDKMKSAVVTLAKQILAKEGALPLEDLSSRIVDDESLPKSDVRTDRETAVRNILRQYAETGCFVRKGHLIYALNGPVALLLDKGFRQTHSNQGNGDEALRHFEHPDFPNVHFQIFDYGDGNWSHQISTYRTEDEHARVEEIVSELNRLPGRVPRRVWS